MDVATWIAAGVEAGIVRGSQNRIIAPNLLAQFTSTFEDPSLSLGIGDRHNVRSSLNI